MSAPSSLTRGEAAWPGSDIPFSRDRGPGRSARGDSSPRRAVRAPVSPPYGRAAMISESAGSAPMTSQTTSPLA
jgi:hypothetical protein